MFNLQQEYIPIHLIPGDTRKFKGPDTPAAPPPPAAPATAGDTIAGSKVGSASRLTKQKSRLRKGIRSTLFAGRDESLEPRRQLPIVKNTLGGNSRPLG